MANKFVSVASIIMSVLITGAGGCAIAEPPGAKRVIWVDVAGGGDTRPAVAGGVEIERRTVARGARAPAAVAAPAPATRRQPTAVIPPFEVARLAALAELLQRQPPPRSAAAVGGGAYNVWAAAPLYVPTIRGQRPTTLVAVDPLYAPYGRWGPSSGSQYAFALPPPVSGGGMWPMPAGWRINGGFGGGGGGGSGDREQRRRRPAVERPPADRPPASTPNGPLPRIDRPPSVTPTAPRPLAAPPAAANNPPVARPPLLNRPPQVSPPKGVDRDDDDDDRPGKGGDKKGKGNGKGRNKGKGKGRD